MDKPLKTNHLIYTGRTVSVYYNSDHSDVVRRCSTSLASVAIHAVLPQIEQLIVYLYFITNTPPSSSRAAKPEKQKVVL